MPSTVAEDPSKAAETAGERVRSFRTKSGRCLVDDTYLHVESSYWGYYRNLYEGYWSSGWFGKSVVLWATLAPLYFGWMSIRAVRDDPFSTPLLLAAGGIGLILLFSCYRRIVQGYTAADWIPLANVRVVESNRGSKGFTRPRLLVEYDADGATRRRYLMLPSLYTSGGEEEFEKARRVLADAGLRVE